MRRAFSLLELLTTLAIIAVLAALAIPQIHDATMRARQAEVATMVSGITTVITAYITANNVCPPYTGAPHPSGGGSALVAWAPAPNAWAKMGFAPDGSVRGVYHAGDVGICFAQGIQNLDRDLVDYSVEADLDETTMPPHWTTNITCDDGGGPIPGPCF